MVCIINKTSFVLWQLSSCLAFALHSYSQQSHWCHTSLLQRVIRKCLFRGVNYDEKPITKISFMFHESSNLCLKPNTPIDLFHYPKFITWCTNFNISAVPRIWCQCFTHTDSSNFELQLLPLFLPLLLQQPECKQTERWQRRWKGRWNHMKSKHTLQHQSLILTCHWS